MDATALLHLLDALCIAPFRLLPDPTAGFHLGTATLCLVCVVLGEYTMALAYLGNKAHFDGQSAEMVRMHNLSVRAIRARDKASYTASNTLANDSFGKAFFAQAALFATSVWPVPFALGWMSTRFSGVAIPLPFTPWTVGFTAVFFPTYILLRVAFSRVKRRLPLLGHAARRMREAAQNSAPVLSWADLGASQDQPRQSVATGTTGPSSPDGKGGAGVERPAATV
ncbi:MAG: hypothetical protein AB7E47_01215 [Desulfovibrionaceae bacterium]